MVRKYIAGFYMRVYIVILFGLIYGMQDFPNTVITYMVPVLFFAQLLHLAVLNNRLFPSMVLQFALCASKLVLFCYFKLHKNNFMRVPVNHAEIYISFVALVGGLMVLDFQKRVHPRLCFARFFADSYRHDYFVNRAKLAQLEIDDMCPICYDNLDNSHEIDWQTEMPQLSTNLRDYIKQRDALIMQTPCNHYYHTSCLLSVMNFKMCCPVCRKTLPNVE